jgi:hypothetical protein
MVLSKFSKDELKKVLDAVAKRELNGRYIAGILALLGDIGAGWFDFDPETK